MFFRTLTLLSLCLIAPWVSADASDHPLLSRYPNAEIFESLSIQYETYRMPTGPAGSNGSVSYELLVGDLTMLTYELEGVSTLKVFENYKSALAKLDADIQAVCELEECGETSDALDQLGDALAVRDDVYNYYRKPYFIRSQLAGVKGTVHVAIFVGGDDGSVQVQQAIVEEVPAEHDLIATSEEYLARKPEGSSPEDLRTPEQKKDDHPLIARYPGARLENVRKVEYERVDVPFGEQGSTLDVNDSLSLTGDISLHTYTVNNVSTLKVMENYRSAIEDLGFDIGYECALEACGGSELSEEIGGRIAVNESVYNYYRKPYYFVAQKDAPQGSITLALFFGGDGGDVRVQQAIVEEKGTQKDLVKVDADQLYQDIQQSGKALVYGIYFDTDSAAVKPESADALQAISTLLESHPELNLYVVGHTDDTGEGDYNLNLSSRRAAAVVDVLKTEYSLENSRLEPAGVGPYAPVAGNESDQGRRLNRRVELVRKL